MKVILQESPQYIQGGWSDNTYYLCETEEEYQQKLAEYRQKRKEIEEATDPYADFRRRRWYISEDIKISRVEKMINYDGFVESDGRSLSAEGFRWHEEYERSDKNLFFIKPNSVTSSKGCRM